MLQTWGDIKPTFVQISCPACANTALPKLEMQWPSGFWQVLPPGLQLPALPPPFPPPPLALPLPKWLLEHQECKCIRQCHLHKYFWSSTDVFLWTFSCIILHRAVLWLEVVGLMFPSTGKHLGLVVWKQEFGTWSSAPISPVRQGGIALHGSRGQICKSDPILCPLARK